MDNKISNIPLFLNLYMSQKTNHCYEKNLIYITMDYLPKKWDTYIIQNIIEEKCPKKISKGDMDWLIRFYKYYQTKYDEIKCEKQKKFDDLFEDVLEELYNINGNKKLITTLDIERLFHPYSFFGTRDIPFGRGPRLRKLKI